VTEGTLCVDGPASLGGTNREVYGPSLSDGDRAYEYNTYRHFYVVIFVCGSSLLPIKSGIRVIPSLVKESIIGKAKRIWLIGSVLRVLRHDADVRWVPEILIN
jgi:hypothetical protein